MCRWGAHVSAGLRTGRAVHAGLRTARNGAGTVGPGPDSIGSGAGRGPGRKRHGPGTGRGPPSRPGARHRRRTPSPGRARRCGASGSRPSSARTGPPRPGRTGERAAQGADHAHLDRSGARPAQHGDPLRCGHGRRAVAVTVRGPLVRVPPPGTQGRDPGWDPLGPAVEGGHARGLELHAWYNPYRIANPPTRPAGRLAPGAQSTPTGRSGTAAGSTTTPVCRRSAPSCGGRCSTRSPGTRSTPSAPTTTSTLSDRRADLRRRRGVRPLRRRLLQPGRLAPGQHRQAGAGDGRRCQGGPARRRFGISPLGVWRNASTDTRGSDTRAGRRTYDDLYADTRRWVREHWIDYINAAAVLAHRLLGRRLRPAGGLVGAGRPGRQDASVRRRGAVPGGRRGGSPRPGRTRPSCPAI